MTEIKTLEPKRNYWKREEELLLKQWADKAKCYHWLHNKSREIYQRKNALFTIPVIIISTIVGTANFAQDRFSEDMRQYVVIAIGTLSIIAGIITTIYQFLKISEINEGHRVSLLSWGKFYVDIESELARHPLDRMSPSELIKISKNEFVRLLEVSPFIPKKVLREFNNKFKSNNDLVKPEIGNNINPMNLFNMDTENRQKMIEDLNKGIIIKNKEIVQKKITKENKINKFKNSFAHLNNREPTKEEIRKHIKYTEIDNYNDSENSSDNMSDILDNYDNIRHDIDNDIQVNDNIVIDINEVSESLSNSNNSDEPENKVPESENKVPEPENIVPEPENIVPEPENDSQKPINISPNTRKKTLINMKQSAV